MYTMEFMIGSGNFRDILFIVLWLLFGCTTAQDYKVTNLEGTWIGCDEEGTYVEIHFSKYECIYAESEIVEMAYSVPYSVWKNEIHTTNARLAKTYQDTFLIEEDLMTLTVTDRIFKLRKISDFPIVPLESRSMIQTPLDTVSFPHYMRMFTLREAEYECK